MQCRKACACRPPAGARRRGSERTGVGLVDKGVEDLLQHDALTARLICSLPHDRVTALPELAVQAEAVCDGLLKNVAVAVCRGQL